MNRKSTVVLATICLLGIFSLSAQKHTVRNFLSLNANTAYTGQVRFDSHYDFNPFIGGNENIGIGYQLYANHFTLSIGAEIGATVMTNYSNEPITIGNRHIPEGMLELLGNGHVNIPTLIGGEFGKFYFKVGVVPSFNLLNGATILGPVLNPENPDFYENTTKYLYSNPFQLFGRFEIGGSFGRFTPFDDPDQPKARFYLGGYVDFGFTNDQAKVARGSYANRNRVPYALSNQGLYDEVSQLSVGLRFTCLLNCAK